MLIITKNPDLIAKTILDEIGRGATYLHAQGAYSRQDMRMLYVVLNPQEMNYVKAVLNQIDPHAFISIINVHEVIGEGFTWDVRSKIKLPWQKQVKD